MPENLDFDLGDLGTEAGETEAMKPQSLNTFAGEALTSNPALSPKKKKRRVNFPFRMLDSERDALLSVAQHLGKSANELCWELVIPAVLRKKQEIDGN